MASRGTKRGTVEIDDYDALALLVPEQVRRAQIVVDDALKPDVLDGAALVRILVARAGIFWSLARTLAVSC